SPDSTASPNRSPLGRLAADEAESLGAADAVPSSVGWGESVCAEEAASAVSSLIVPTRKTGSAAASAVFASSRVASGSELDGVHAVSRASAERAAMAPCIFVDNREPRSSTGMRTANNGSERKSRKY